MVFKIAGYPALCPARRLPSDLESQKLRGLPLTALPSNKSHFFPLSCPCSSHLLLPEVLVLGVDDPDSPFDGQQPAELVVRHHGRGEPALTALSPRSSRSAPAARRRPDLTKGGGATA